MGLGLEDILLGGLADRVASFRNTQKLTEQFEIAVEHIDSGERVRPAIVGLLQPGDDTQLDLLILLPLRFRFLDGHVTGQFPLSGVWNLLRDHQSDVACYLCAKSRTRPRPSAAVVSR